MELGPHQDTIKLPVTEVKKVQSNSNFHSHSFSSALMLIALLSFAGNIAFTYLGFVKNGNIPEIDAQAISQTFSGRLGSDDGNIMGEPPMFIPSIHFKAKENLSPLKISAESYLVADAETGEVLLEKNADTVHPMASVSKLLTAIVSKDHIDTRHQAVVSKDSYNTYGAEGELSTGEKILVSDLFYPLLMESSNDAAEVLADDYGRDNFLMLLNDRATALGMYSTTYEDPSGLSPKNISTAHDLTKLALYIYAVYPDMLDITRIKEHSIFNHTWKNANKFLTYPNFLGGKNGFIQESKQTTVSFFKVFFRGTDTQSKAVDRPLVVVLLHSSDRDADAGILLSYVAKNIRYAETE